MKSTLFQLDNTFSGVSKTLLVTHIFKVLLPISLLGLIRMKGVGGKSPANIYLFKVNSRNFRKGVKFVQN